MPFRRLSLPFLAVFLFLGTTNCVAQTPQNLLPNPAMTEIDKSGDIPAGWTGKAIDSGSLRIVRDTAEFVSAPASLSVIAENNASGNVNTSLPQTVAGHGLIISGKIKSRDDAKGLTTVQVVLFAQNEKYQVIQWQPVYNRADKTADWKSFTGKATVPDGAKNILLMLYLRGEGKVWLDDLSVNDESGVHPTYDAPKPDAKELPTIERIYTIAPNIVAVQIAAGTVVQHKMSRYIPQPGDKIDKRNDGARLIRGSNETGYLIGNKNDTLVTYEYLAGAPLVEKIADWTGAWQIVSTDDDNYKKSTLPTVLYRKSKPTNWALPIADPKTHFAMRHTLYLKLAAPLTLGKKYTIRHTDPSNPNIQLLKNPSVDFVYNPDTIRSEAVHISQIGYRPDDPAKRAFLSIWLGTGGGYKYADLPAFHLVDAKTGKSVYSGKAVLAYDISDKESLQREDNFSKTAIYRMEFGDFKTPGIYKVVVDGVGCSYPFPIERNVWDTAFRLQMHGLYNQRSGIALQPPYTDWTKPRDFHPADGIKVYRSTYNAMDKGGEAFPDLVKGSTGELVKNAWGGYHDAGDWNPRRSTHLPVTIAHLELLDIFPAHFRTMSLNIPKTVGIPDTLTEALFEIDCFRRLQLPNGGVPFGIETDGDPHDGEVSWMARGDAYVYAPDIRSTYIYANAAALAAYLLEAEHSPIVKTYLISAVKAMNWAEADYAKRKAAGTLDKLPWEVRDARNLAALQLYRLTSEKKYHDLFLENTTLTKEPINLFAYGDHVQRDAAFLYARLKKSLGEPKLKASAIAGLRQQADAALVYASGNGFNITTPDKGKPMFTGFFSTPDAIELVRAHFLTGDPKYLAGAVQACQFAAGDNPNNMTYTTGLGSNPVRHPLHLDSRSSGQKTPDGLTVYGNFDFIRWSDQNWALWPLKYHLSQVVTPDVFGWPITEAYFDIYLHPSIAEFTVDMWAPNVYVWGYLAARK